MACRLENPQCFIKKARKRTEPFKVEKLYTTGIDFDQCSYCFYTMYGYNRSLLKRMTSRLPDDSKELKLLKGLISNLSISKDPGIRASLWSNGLSAIALVISGAAVSATIFSGMSKGEEQYIWWLKAQGIVIVIMCFHIVLSFFKNQKKSMTDVHLQKEYLAIYEILVEEKIAKKNKESN